MNDPFFLFIVFKIITSSSYIKQISRVYIIQYTVYHNIFFCIVKRKQKINTASTHFEDTKLWDYT